LRKSCELKGNCFTFKSKKKMVILKSESQVASFLKRQQATDYNRTIYDIGSAFIDYKSTTKQNNRIIEEQGKSIWWDNYQIHYKVLAIIKIKKK